MFALGIDYLTGYAAATDPWDRNRAEWPPHPGRVFMALAAAYFETRPFSGDSQARAESEAEAAALRWLEEQPPPSLAVSDADHRSVLDVYVPPNDNQVPAKDPDKLKAKAINSALTVIPSRRTNRQPRTFPRVRPHSSQVMLLWPHADPSAEQRIALERLCAKVIRVGHSSSFVRMWVAQMNETPKPNLVPPEEHGDRIAAAVAHRLRVVGPGALKYLEAQFNGEAVERFFDLSGQIQSSKGKAKKELLAAFEHEFGMPWKRTLAPPPSLRPVLSLTQEYVRPDHMNRPAPNQTWFDSNLLVLAQHDGPTLGLETTWQLVTALRGAIEKHCQPTPEWVSGHQPDGKPSEQPHLALLPLGYVGSEHADGHILGVALAFPRDIPARDRGKALGNLLYDDAGSTKEITLTLGRAGVCTFRLEERPSPPRALRPETWTAAPAGATTWASVSPVVLDRHPKTDPAKNRVGWTSEVAEIVAAACERVGLPRPVEIDVNKTSWHRGAPCAKPGPDGYPLMPQRPGGPNRRQVHVWLRFNEPVEGPVILGSGRYRGYGFCKPWMGNGS